MREFERTLAEAPLILTEGAVIERLRRGNVHALDPHIAHAAFVYSPERREALAEIYRGYINAAEPSGQPFLIFTPTWRASADRVLLSALSKRDVNGDNARFMTDLRKEAGPYAEKIFIGGLIGCRGDAYKPDEALDAAEAHRYHSFQVNALADSGVDFLCAATLPAISEAVGVARAMSAIALPYILSFVLRRNGKLLDGTPLHNAIGLIDSAVTRKPAGYMVNCTHPTIVHDVLQSGSERVRQRCIGLQANTSSRNPEELDGSAFLDTEDPEVFASLMFGLHRSFGLKILGGCCGTDDWHIRALVREALRRPRTIQHKRRPER